MREESSADGAPAFDVTSLGETMVRLSVGAGTRLAEARHLDVHAAGAESNVCAALAGLGRRTGFVTRLPRNPLGELVARRLRTWGVDANGIVWASEGRIGTYFVELAAPPLPIRITYDRAGSAFTHLTPEEVDWDRLLDTRMVHLTGITPALGPSCRHIVNEAVARAKDRGVRVAFDVNHRARLWSAQEAAEALKPIVRDADLLFCKKDDAETLFGLSADDASCLAELRELSGARDVVLSLGAEGALASDNERTYHRTALPVTVVDRIGAGDAFAAGVIDGVIDGRLEAGLDTGTHLAALALAQHGDVVLASRDEVDAMARVGGPDVLR